MAASTKLARMLGGEASPTASGVGARDAGGARERGRREGRKAKARKAKAKGRTAKAQGTTWREIPDRDVRLPDERPRLRADGGPARAGRLRADRRRRRRRRRRHQHLQRPRARGREALHAPRRAARAGRGDRARPDRRRRRLRRAAGRRRAPQALDGVIDVIVGTQAIRSSCRCSSSRRPSAARRAE